MKEVLENSIEHQEIRKIKFLQRKMISLSLVGNIKMKESNNKVKFR